MTDLINRQDAIDAIEAVPDSNWTSKRYSNEIRKLPSAQPDIVYCGECKYQNKGENEVDEWNQCGYRPWLYIPVHDEHYCSWGERREDEQMEHCSDIP